jgi:hypothetical protein
MTNLKQILKKHPWVTSFDSEGGEEWVPDCWFDYLNKNPNLSENDLKIQVIKNLTPKQRISISARLEEALEEARISSYTEWAWVKGAQLAFEKEDYTCSLIYRYIEAKEIERALKF